MLLVGVMLVQIDIGLSVNLQIELALSVLVQIDRVIYPVGISTTAVQMLGVLIELVQIELTISLMQIVGIPGFV